MKKLLCSVLLLSGGLAGAAPPGAAAEKQPKLVLTIIVDQFRYDYLTRFRSSYNSGLARLLAEGAVFSNAYYQHFPTVTAVGHSTILSGATPSVSGIVGNEWYDRELGRQVTSVSDASVPLLGASGKEAASPRKLLVSTVGDELKMSGKGRKVIGISIKDRSAILPAGHMADAAYWFDGGSGNFVSSGYYFAELPGWVRHFNSSRLADSFTGKEWCPLDSPSGKLFLRMASKPGPAYFNSLERSPYGNELVEAFAEQAVKSEGLGRGAAIDLLSVSFSSNDYVGHALGPDSPQVRDISIRTDRLLGKFFHFIDGEIGMQNVLVVFTADHGVAPMPEVMQQRKMPGGRIPEGVVLDAVLKTLTELYGEGQWVVGKSGPAPYLNYDLIRQKKLNGAAVRNAAAEAVRSLPHIFRVYTRDQLAMGQVLNDLVDRRVSNGFNAERAADLFIVAEPYWLFEKSGTSHGTPFNYDSHVPVIFMGAGVKAGSYPERVVVNDIAPTLATMLEVEVPSGSTGRVLAEMLSAN
jgi:hypothetical protein